MPVYDFRSLSSLEFEALARDLLQADLRLRLESFAPGPDGGLDARWSSPKRPIGNVAIAVQCKHMPKAKGGAVVRAFQAEKPKADRLNPERYIAVTSADLSRSTKDKIAALLAPHIRATGDVLAQADLNNLLGRFPEVESQHYKLWLTSTTVLAKLLQSPSFVDSAAAVDRMRERLQRYVPNESFSRAMILLDTRRFCVITGDPGIGKTTLAEALLVHHVDIGFEALRVTNKLSELKGITDPERAQVFYYDDFLGKTGLDKLEHNENDQLIDFIRQVAKTPKWRLILTTRDYILAAARQRYEALDQLRIELWKCVIDLPVYTLPVRATILFNHIFFSKLEAHHKKALLQRDVLERIVRHPNYNPRVVEHMTDIGQLFDVSPTAYPAEFLANLDNPQRVWAHAFKTHISEAARNLLRSMVPKKNEIPLEVLSVAFWRLHEYARQRYGLTTRPDDFEAALKELDGSLVRTDRGPSGLQVRFRNPSVRDFLESHLGEHEREVQDLVVVVVEVDEFERLWEGRRNTPYGALIREPRVFVQRYAEAVRRELAQLRAIRQSDRAFSYLGVAGAVHNHLLVAAAIVRATGDPDAVALAQELANDACNGVERGRYDPDELNDLVALVDENVIPGQSEEGSLFAAFLAKVLEDQPSLDDAEWRVRFVTEHHGSLPVSMLDDFKAVLRHGQRDLVDELIGNDSSQQASDDRERLVALMRFANVGEAEIDSARSRIAEHILLLEEREATRKNKGNIQSQLSKVPSERADEGLATAPMPRDVMAAFSAYRSSLDDADANDDD